MLENIDRFALACVLQVFEGIVFAALFAKILAFTIKNRATVNVKILTYIVFAAIGLMSCFTKFTKVGVSIHIIMKLTAFVSFQVFLYESIQIDKSDDITTSEVMNLQKQYKKYSALVYLFSTTTAYIAAICVPLLVLQFNAIDLKNAFAAVALLFVTIYCCILAITVKKRKSLYVIAFIYAFTMFILLICKAIVDNAIYISFINECTFLYWILGCRAFNLATLAILVLQREDVEAFND